MRTTTDAAMPPKLPAADLADLLSVMTRVVLPTFGKGVILRRPSMERLAERFALDSRAVKTMQALRRKHGSLPLRLPLPGRPIILLLDPADVAAVLAHTPDPFETNTWEKRAALGHFEPGNVLISDAPRRATLRPLHEAALATASRSIPAARRSVGRSRRSLVPSSCPVPGNSTGRPSRKAGPVWCGVSCSDAAPARTKP